jgi:hypothetical protein
MMGAEVCPLTQRRIRLNMYEHRRHVAMAHYRKSQSLNAVVGVQTIGDGAGAKVIRYDRNVLILRIVHGLWSVVPRLKPCVLANSVEAMELMKHFDESGVTCIVC